MYKGVYPALGLAGICLLLGMFTTFQQVRHLNSPTYLNMNGDQHFRTQVVLEGRAGNPWQYRVLAPFVVAECLKIAQALSILNAYPLVFISLRVVLDASLLFIAFFYYSALKLPWQAALLGVGILAWSVSYAYYDSDLQYNTYLDVALYLLAGWLVLQQRNWWLVIVTALAALNRETSAFLPFLPLVAALANPHTHNRQNAYRVALACAGIYWAIFILLRLSFPAQALVLAYDQHPGWQLLRYNLLRTITWEQLVATLGIIPLVALLQYRSWQAPLRAFFWLVVPLWTVVHLLSAVLAEARLMLVPQALIFIPAALSILGAKDSA